MKIIKLRNINFGNMEKATMSRPKICLVKCYLEEETMQRRMNGIFAGEEDLCVLLIGNSLSLTIGQCLLPFSLHFWPSCYPFVYACKADHIC